MKMTIAAGFVHRDGVMVCADTQFEDWDKKFNQSKVGTFGGEWGSLVYAMAGAGDFALAAVQKIKRSLAENRDGNKTPLSIIESAVDRQYRKTVFAEPDYRVAGLDYWLLIGLWNKGDLRPRLYATQKTAVIEVDWFRCIGAGDAYANHLLGSSFSSQDSERDVLCLAAHALSMAKDKVPGCGGASLFLSLRTDGKAIQFFNSPLVEHIENVALEYERACQDLLLRHMEEGDLSKSIQEFTQRVIHMRRGWDKIKDKPTTATPIG